MSGIASEARVSIGFCEFGMLKITSSSLFFPRGQGGQARLDEVNRVGLCDVLAS
jgi:hypothetical protein